ncbi:DUF2141 domain-containing protein [Brunnivagina elsteri]|uniref:DUF2141 domain-containing protein n=1 Tax=Brunnivagina elsteri CCALA 953 TaxID=987040 RepID=A0A2A2TN74_9CYAN|nr:DUF2141 domain-containing protein [Calothrix elsteri]PAX59939.1 hypothetical protein CK510_04380 [Calothrix elsteri CCALA 953]
MTKRLRISLLLLPFLGTLLGSLIFSDNSQADLRGKLNIEIDELRSNHGEVCVNLFASSKGFPQEEKRAVQKQCVKITETPLVVKFDDLKAGSYALVVMHDENSDKAFNRNNLGMPLEGFGFSQNPEISDRAPKFSETAFFVAGPTTDIKVKLQYMALF